MEITRKDYIKIKPFKLLKEIIIWGIIFFILLIPFVKKIEFQGFHGDENYWLRSSKYFKLFFIDKDIHNKQWEGYLAYDQPPVGKYIIGLALSIAGHGDKIKALDDMRYWNFDKDYNWNVDNGAMPPKEILYVARLTMAILGSLTCLLIYWIGKKIFSARTGLIAALLLAYNPLMLSCSRKAMTDAPLLFFLTTNIVLTMFFYQALLKQKLLRTFVFAVLIGINIALATGTKLNGSLTAIIFVSFCILVALIKANQCKFPQSIFGVNIDKLKTNKEIKIILSSLLISGVIAIFVFVIINPYLYNQPLKKVIHMVRNRMSVIYYQQEHFGHALTSLSKKFCFVIRRTLLPGNYVVLGNIFEIPIDFVFFLLGLIMLLYTELKYLLKNYRLSLRSIIILWIVITFVATITLIPLDWDRYYFPVIPCVAIMLGYSSDKIIEKFWRVVKRLNSHFKKQ